MSGRPHPISSDTEIFRRKEALSIRAQLHLRRSEEFRVSLACFNCFLLSICQTTFVSFMLVESRLKNTALVAALVCQDD